MSFDGDQYPNTAAKVITTRGDIVRGNSSGDRERYGIGAANTVLTSDGTDPDWAAAALAPTTTKGDISGYTTTQARIPISTNNFSLYGDSTAALGLKWAASPTSTLTTTGDLLAASAANVLTRIAGGASGEILTGNGAGVLPTFQAAAAALEVACSDETTAISASTDLITFRMPYAMTLNAGTDGVRGGLTTAGTGAALLTVDIHQDGTSILSTKLTFDATETETVNAATPVVIGTTTLTDNAEITVDVDTADSGGVAAGLKIILIGDLT